MTVDSMSRIEKTIVDQYFEANWVRKAKFFYILSLDIS